MKHFLTFILITITILAKSQVQTDFQLVQIGVNWSSPMGSAFDKSGRMYVWERDGKVQVFFNNTKTQLLDISEEIATYGDLGLTGFALDPDYMNNGFFYLFYDVDRHFLMNYGTAAYSATKDEEGASIARITRYKVNVSTFKEIVPNSRFVILGSDKTNGIPIIGRYHPGGDIRFAQDGTLLASFGDNSLGAAFEDQAIGDKILNSDEMAVPATWRCQIKNSMEGKIIRIDPSTGSGVSSNPFFDVNNPNSPASKVWAMGLRNPFRFTIKPNSGGNFAKEGNPGVIFIGDVGQDKKEKIHVVTKGGQNFGWPRWEGIDLLYASTTDTSLYPQNRKLPTIEWGRSESARVVVNSVVKSLGTADFPSENFVGGCSIGGEFYTGDVYPTKYKNTYFFTDFNKSTSKFVNLDASNNPTAISAFLYLPGLVHLAYNPIDQHFYYTALGGYINKIVYVPNGNHPPKANFTFTPNYGKSPLSVNLDASTSSDIEDTDLTYKWVFGDNTAATGKMVSKIFNTNDSSPKSIKIGLYVTDKSGAVDSVFNVVSLNNTPPIISSTSIDNINYWFAETNETIHLDGVVSDKEEPNANLKFRWQSALFHNDHLHPELDINQLSKDYILGAIECDANTYYYTMLLTVEDSYGLQSVFSKKIYPDCVPLAKAATSNSANSFVANWKKFANVTKYEIDVAKDNNFTTVLQNYNMKLVNDTTFLISGLQPNLAYFYRVRGVNGENVKSKNSNIIAASTSNYALRSQESIDPNPLYSYGMANLKSTITNLTQSDFTGYFRLSIQDNSKNVLENSYSSALTTLKYNENIVLQRPTQLLKLPVGTYNLVSSYSTTNNEGSFVNINSVSFKLNELLANNIENDEFKLITYPNPTNDSFSILLDNTILNNSNLEIFSLNGQLLTHFGIKVNAKNERPVLSLKNLNEGVYIAKLILASGEELKAKVLLIK